MSDNFNITVWNLDYDFAQKADECRILFAYAQKVVLLILARKPDPKKTTTSFT